MRRQKLRTQRSGHLNSQAEKALGRFFGHLLREVSEGDRPRYCAGILFPAAHWQHIRTTHRVQLRHGSASNGQDPWLRLQGDNLAKVVQGVRFKNGREIVPRAQNKKTKGAAA